MQAIRSDLEKVISNMRDNLSRDPSPDIDQRIDRLNRLKRALLVNKDALTAAVDKDFGVKSRPETLITEILPVLEGLHSTKKNLCSWMKVAKRSVPLILLGSSTKVHYQPLGVVGIAAPWTFPIFLTMSPLIGALAAGNRVILRTSDTAPQTGDVIKTLISDTFGPEEVFVETSPDWTVSRFAKLPLDHLVFTGSTESGQLIMHAASENLTPVTLNAAGKSPAIIHEEFPIEEAANHIARAKVISAGQTCTSPDYVLVSRNRLDEFIEAFTHKLSSAYPFLEMNPDYTAIISDAQRERLMASLEDAMEKGAELIALNPGAERFATTRKLPIYLLKRLNDEMHIMKEAIFGPILPVLPYDTLESAIRYVKARPRPPVLYYFDWNKARAEVLIQNTSSGGICINGAMTHIAVDDMPFAGTGTSSLGSYHGKEGFLHFSKAKAVVRKGKLSLTTFLDPPWDKPLSNAYIAFQLWRLGRLL